MKRTKVLTTVSLILIVTLVPFTGCSTTTYVTYSFAEDDSPSALLDFTWESSGGFFTDQSYVGFINYDGAKLPKPEKKTKWATTIKFPAEEPLPLTVRAQYVAPIPMLSIAAVTGEFTGNVAGVGGNGWGVILLLPVVLAGLAVTLSFFALALVVDLPMGLIMNFDKKVAFDCPPLEADRTYALVLQRKKPRKLVLLDVDGDSGTEIYEQKF